MFHVDGGILTDQQQAVGSVFVAMILAGIILVYVSMIVFILTVCKNPFFDNGKKVFWGLMLYFFNMFVYPIYLHKYVLRE